MRRGGDQVRTGVIAGKIDVAIRIDCKSGWFRGIEPVGPDGGGEQQLRACGVKLGDENLLVPRLRLAQRD